MLSPRHCVHVRLWCFQSEFVLKRKLCTKGGKTPESFVLSRFNLISTNWTEVAHPSFISLRGVDSDRTIEISIFFFFLTLYRHNRSNYCGSTNTWESVQTKTNLINISSKIKIIKYRLLRVKQSWIKGCVKMEQIYRNWHLFYFIIHRITNTK